MGQIKAAHTTLSISRLGGGLQFSVMGLSRTLLAEREVKPVVLAPYDQFSNTDVPLWDPLQPCLLPTWGPRAFQYMPDLRPTLRKENVDLVHGHGIWLYPAIATMKWARETGRPYIISPRGMLDPADLQKSRWRKAVALRLYESRHLTRANCIHALCDSEAVSIRRFGLKGPVCVIPNGVSIPNDKDESLQRPAWLENIAHGRKILLFLARVNAKKGVRQLIDAFSIVHARNRQAVEPWVLAIAGWDQGGFEAAMKAHVRQLGLEHYVKFPGPLHGDAKAEALRFATAFTLPSTGEGLPMSVLEAWSYRLPALITPQCNLPEASAAGAALVAEPLAPNLAEGLDSLFRMSDHDLKEMGERAYALVLERFTWSRVAEEMRSVYDWLLGGGAPPACIHFA